MSLLPAVICESEILFCVISTQKKLYAFDYIRLMNYRGFFVLFIAKITNQYFNDNEDIEVALKITCFNITNLI